MIWTTNWKPMRQVVLTPHPHRPTLVRIWEVVGGESEFPFIAVESSLN